MCLLLFVKIYKLVRSKQILQKTNCFEIIMRQLCRMRMILAAILNELITNLHFLIRVNTINYYKGDFADVRVRSKCMSNADRQNDLQLTNCDMNGGKR